MKIRPVGAELFHADGWTDRQTEMTKLIVTFYSFANAPKSCKVSCRRKKLCFWHCKTRGGE